MSIGVVDQIGKIVAPRLRIEVDDTPRMCLEIRIRNSVRKWVEWLRLAIVVDCLTAAQGCNRRALHVFGKGCEGFRRFLGGCHVAVTPNVPQLSGFGPPRGT